MMTWLQSSDWLNTMYKASRAWIGLEPSLHQYMYMYVSSNTMQGYALYGHYGTLEIPLSLGYGSLVLTPTLICVSGH